MKKILILLTVMVTTLAPMSVHADSVSPDEAWNFRYEFPLTWSGGSVVSDGIYRITTGDVSVLAAGSWKLVILDGTNEPLKYYYFDPASLAVSGVFSLVVPIESRGASAYIADTTGRRIVEIDVRESRVCNDNGVCSADAGERYGNCPTDCGGVSQNSEAVGIRSAAITHQVSFGEQAGKLMVRLSLGAAGIMLLAGLARILDSRRRA